MAANQDGAMTFFCPPMNAAQQLAFWQDGMSTETDGLGITIRVDPATLRQQVRDALRGTIDPDDGGGASGLLARAEKLTRIHNSLCADRPEGLASAA